MATRHLFDTLPAYPACWSRSLGSSRRPAAGLAHLPVMDIRTSSDRPPDRPSDPHSGAAEGGRDRDPIDRALTLSELAARLGVSAQTIYDLRSQGRGPRGFRIGRHLRFRPAEIDAWLARLEDADAERHGREHQGHEHEVREHRVREQEPSGGSR